ncbi:MlaD family protein [Dyadobacter arcticus]|uniref:Phospholipid/cholesterol/gamma-HCH transport system substrate-binding protein n=1 Tax=Dyadobacter arcticus TaxID=1078754 RepID=A0ABX0UDL6_9BACT|nr:MlaD family protein [Dyadobacter arcticus]NIJ51092.1 phospholipid/cholesterol/gamma-HCH transport system substrate-binding protein [Dyadobacter arcticus]
MKISREAKVGIMAILAMVMLYFGFHILKGSDVFSRTYKYYVVYDNIDGLTASNPVLLNGLNVGRVQEIRLLQNRKNHLLVSLDVQKGVAVPKGTTAVLADGGLLGGKVIHLTLGNGATLQDGDTLLANKESGISAVLQEQALPLVTHADSLIKNLSQVVAGFQETGLILNQVLRNYNQTGSNLQGLLDENRSNLLAMTSNLNKLSTSLIETEKELKPLLAKTGTLADSLSALKLGETVQNANRTIGELHTLLASVESGKGTAGKLIKDETLYTNIDRTIVSLNKLLTNLREHPKRYINISVFSKKDKGPSESTLDTATKVN